MNDSFKSILFAFITITLGATLLLFAINNQASLYDKDTSEVTAGALDFNQFNNSITSVSTDAQLLRQKFESQSIFSPLTVAGVVVTGIFDIAKTMVVMIITPFTLLAGISTNILHIPAFVTNVLLGLIIMAIIFGIWRLVRVGT